MSGEEPWINLLLRTSTQRRCRIGTERKEESGKRRCERKNKLEDRVGTVYLSVCIVVEMTD